MTAPGPAPGPDLDPGPRPSAPPRVTGDALRVLALYLRPEDDAALRRVLDFTAAELDRLGRANRALRHAAADALEAFDDADGDDPARVAALADLRIALFEHEVDPEAHAPAPGATREGLLAVARVALEVYREAVAGRALHGGSYRHAELGEALREAGLIPA